MPTVLMFRLELLLASHYCPIKTLIFTLRCC